MNVGINAPSAGLVPNGGEMSDNYVDSSEDLTSSTDVSQQQPQQPQDLENQDPIYTSVDGSLKPGTTRPWSLADFEIGRLLGQGAFGNVFLARERRTKFLVVLKVLSKKRCLEARCDIQLAIEMEVQMQLRHPNITRMYGFFHDMTHIFFIIEFAAKGDMFNYLHSLPNRRFPEPDAAKYFYHILRALSFMHFRHIIHRDIKPENILIDVNDVAKLADVGWACHTSLTTRPKHVCGTVQYLPPEMVYAREYDSRVDNWSMGILLYEMLHGFAPIDVETISALRAVFNKDQNEHKLPHPNIQFHKDISPEARSLILSLLQFDPNNRISIEDAMKHSFITRFRKQKKPLPPQAK